MLTEELAVRMQSAESDNRRARWRLSTAHVELLVAALRSDWSMKRVTAEQRSVIREICRAPERARYAPEDFLIAFKLALVDAANAARLPPGPERNDLLAELVSVCIDEFYRASSITNSGTLAKDRQETAPGH
jgi:hypothetical protein